MTAIAKRNNSKPKPRKAVDQVLAAIRHPTLRVAYETDCYYPWSIPVDDRRGERVRASIEEGWSEWIETPLDLKAVRQGYVFDLSRDARGRAVYWHDGGWWRYRNGRLVEVDEQLENLDRWHIGAGDFVCRFIELNLLHTKHDQAGTPIRMIPVHRKNVMTVFGWINKETGLRRYVSSYWEMAKKNAKTTTIAGLILYLIMADGYVNPSTGEFRRENRAAVYGAARDSNQAREAFDESAAFVRINPLLAAQVEVITSRARMIYPETASFYQVLSMDAASSDGKDAHAVVLDELHAHRDRKLLMFTSRAGRSRRQPLNMIITTAGDNPKSVWMDERMRAKKVIEGNARDLRHHAAIFSGEPFQVSLTEPASVGDEVLHVERLPHPIVEGEVLRFGSDKSDQGEAETNLWPIETPNPLKKDDQAERLEVRVTEYAKRFQPFLKVTPVPAPIEQYATSQANEDWTTDHAIRCANPSVGITCKMEELQLDRDRALDDPSRVPEYKRFTISTLAESSTQWINLHAWNRCAGLPHDWRKLIGKPCFGGLDLSMTNDLTAFWLAFPSWPIGTRPGKHDSATINLLGLCWLPTERIVERESQEDVQYRHLAERSNFGDFGYCRIHDGPTVNHGLVAADILKCRDMFQIQAVAYDPNMGSFIIEPFLSPAGLMCISHRQGSISMGPPASWFDTFVRQVKLAHGGHPLMDVAATHAVLHSPDKVGNRYPAKGKSRGRIDPIIAGVMAVGYCCDPPKDVVASGAWSGAPGSGMWE